MEDTNELHIKELRRLIREIESQPYTLENARKERELKKQLKEMKK